MEELGHFTEKKEKNNKKYTCVKKEMGGLGFPPFCGPFLLAHSIQSDLPTVAGRGRQRAGAKDAAAGSQAW